MLREMLDKVLERAVGHLSLVGPWRVAKDALQPIWVCCLNGTEGCKQRAPYVPCRSAHVLPVGPIRDHEAIVRGFDCVAYVAGLLERLLVIFVPDVGQALKEHQREDVLLIVAGIDEPTEQCGRAPKVVFEFALDQLGHCSHPPSTSTLR